MAQSIMKIDPPILERSYSDRQLIVVMDDEVVRAARKAEKQIVEQQKGGNWSKLGEIALHFFMADLLLITEITTEVIKAWGRARESGVNIFAISRSEATQLIFPPGHPRNAVLYIGHPAMPKVYYTTADFHRVTFEHKFAEAIDLLMHLGATKIRVEHVTGWSKEFSSHLSIPLGQGGETVGGEASASKTSGSRILYQATLDGTSKPEVPDGLVWYPHEPAWQSIAKGRVQFGLRNFTLNVSYDDDFGVNAGLKSAVLKAGLEIGGKFEDHQSTVWKLEGEFAPKN